MRELLINQENLNWNTLWSFIWFAENWQKWLLPILLQDNDMFFQFTLWHLTLCGIERSNQGHWVFMCIIDNVLLDSGAVRLRGLLLNFRAFPQKLVSNFSFILAWSFPSQRDDWHLLHKHQCIIWSKFVWNTYSKSYIWPFSLPLQHSILTFDEIERANQGHWVFSGLYFHKLSTFWP